MECSVRAAARSGDVRNPSIGAVERQPYQCSVPASQDASRRAIGTCQRCTRTRRFAAAPRRQCDATQRRSCT